MRTRVLNHFHTFYPDEQAELNTLIAEEKKLNVEQARRARGDDDGEPKRRRMSEPPEDIDARLDEIRARMEELRAVIASGVVRIVLRALPRKGGRGAFRRLLMEHPPRDGDDLDAQLGYNSDTFGDALIQACIYETRALAPDGTSGDLVPNEWDKWADEMSDGQWEEVFTACLDLNKGGNPNIFPR